MSCTDLPVQAEVGLGAKLKVQWAALGHAGTGGMISSLSTIALPDARLGFQASEEGDGCVDDVECRFGGMEGEVGEGQTDLVFAVDGGFSLVNLAAAATRKGLVYILLPHLKPKILMLRHVLIFVVMLCYFMFSSHPVLVRSVPRPVFVRRSFSLYYSMGAPKQGWINSGLMDTVLYAARVSTSLEKRR
ncbi:hypothetical protein ONZ45_g19389 [Pleurotus djamor]|nr:hypothetical protein ONZ45_g19389 [Pleurotus djamor]